MLLAIDDADYIRSDFLSPGTIAISLDFHGRGPARRRVAASLLSLAACLRLVPTTLIASVLDAAGESSELAETCIVRAFSISKRLRLPACM